MGKIVAQVVKRDVVDKLPFGLGRPGFQLAEPVVDAGFTQMIAALGNEDEITGSTLAIPAFQVSVQGRSSRVDKINIAHFVFFVTDPNPSCFRIYVCVFDSQPTDVADPTARPITQGE